MKINLTINDLSEAEAIRVVKLLANEQYGNVGNTVQGAGQPLVAAPQLTAGVSYPVPAPLAASTEEDDGSTGSAVDVTGQLDTRGLPWDERIHSGNKKQKADGTWMKRKGAQELEITNVENELRAKMANGAFQAPLAPVAPAAPQPLAPVAPLPPLPAPVMDNSAAIAAYANPGVMAPALAALAPAPLPPLPPIPSAAPARNFDGVLSRVQAGAAAGRITQEFMNAAVFGPINAGFQVQITGITEMQNRPDIVEYTHKILDANGL